jgi:hypothetical protein
MAIDHGSIPRAMESISRSFLPAFHPQQGKAGKYSNEITAARSQRIMIRTPGKRLQGLSIRRE